MNLERTGVSRSELGSLKSCLVEGDPDQERSASQGKRRAVLVSIVVQLLVLTALVVFPLFSKGEHITFERTPVPPYPRLGSHDPQTHPQIEPRRPTGDYFLVNPLRPNISLTPNPGQRQAANNEPIIDNPGEPTGSPTGVDLVGPGRSPKPPDSADDSRTPKEHGRVVIGHIEQALLVQRVEPVYPRIAITLRHETRVELHAIISTDGSVESLEVLSGDPLFYNSALDAVRQWRYRPTKLNDQPVEVDTHITVIYILNH